MPKVSDWVKDDKLEQIREWKKAGLSNIQIAQNIGISETTFYRWKTKDARIERALEDGNKLANAHIENALFKSATGFYYEESITDYKYVDGVEIKTESRTTRRYARPNIKAIELWLKTKNPEEYAEKEQIQIDLLRCELKKAQETSEETMQKVDEILKALTNTKAYESEYEWTDRETDPKPIKRSR